MCVHIIIYIHVFSCICICVCVLEIEQPKVNVSECVNFLQDPPLHHTHSSFLDSLMIEGKI